MDNVLPLILETLTNKPLSEETETNLLKELRLKFKDKHLKSTNLKKDFEKAILIGEDLGIFRLVDDRIKMPFSLKNKKNQQEVSEPSRSKSVPRKKSSKGNQLETTDKERRLSRRRRGSSSRRRQSRSRSRSRSGARSRSQRSRRVSRR